MNLFLSFSLSFSCLNFEDSFSATACRRMCWKVARATQWVGVGDPHAALSPSSRGQRTGGCGQHGWLCYSLACADTCFHIQMALFPSLWWQIRVCKSVKLSRIKIRKTVPRKRWADSLRSSASGWGIQERLLVFAPHCFGPSRIPPWGVHFPSGWWGQQLQEVGIFVFLAILSLTSA